MLDKLVEMPNARWLFQSWVDYIITRENLTKAELAAKLGISYNHFSNISSCNRQPGKNAVNKLIRYLNISNTDYFYGYTGESSSPKGKLGFIEVHKEVAGGRVNEFVKTALSINNLEVEDKSSINKLIKVNGYFVMETYEEVIKLWEQAIKS